MPNQMLYPINFRYQHLQTYGWYALYKLGRYYMDKPYTKLQDGAQLCVLVYKPRSLVRHVYHKP